VIDARALKAVFGEPVQYEGFREIARYFRVPRAFENLHGLLPRIEWVANLNKLSPKVVAPDPRTKSLRPNALTKNCKPNHIQGTNHCHVAALRASCSPF
jgi:hypothetical protein